MKDSRFREYMMRSGAVIAGSAVPSEVKPPMTTMNWLRRAAEW
jgi:hypothetical protein